jgi:hypothetical protein
MVLVVLKWFWCPEMVLVALGMVLVVLAMALEALRMVLVVLAMALEALGMVLVVLKLFW